MNKICLGLLWFVAGCAVGPDYEAPQVAVPQKWSTGESAASLAYRDDWWSTFDDPVLQQLIREAAAANLSVQQAATRIRDAREQQSMAIAAALPAISARSNLSRRGNNTSAAANNSNNSVPGGGAGFGVGNQIINILQAGFDAQWELDLFGGVRRGIEAAEANVAAEQENRRDVLVSLLAEVARQYVQLRLQQQLLALDQQHLHAQRDTLSLMEVRQRAGLAAELETTRQRALAATTAAQIPLREASIQQTLHGLAILLGQQPDALVGRLGTISALPSVQAAMDDLPSELLRRRPDIRRSERQLAAANAQIGIATAELYPRINLASFLGIQNTRITDISPLGKSWSAAASISAPIFNWGKLQANIRSKEAQHEELLLAYQATILTALGEVEDALVAHRQERQRQTTLQQAVAAEQLALQLSEDRYRSGLSGFLEVLDNQRSVLQAQSSLLQSQAQTTTHLIALYKALGGGWRSWEPVAQEN